MRLRSAEYMDHWVRTQGAADRDELPVSDAQAEPVRLTATIARSFVFRGWILKRAEISTIATGVNAFSI